MAANTAPIYVKNVTGKGTQWTNSDAANTKKAISPTVGAEGTRIHAISAASTDATARDFSLYLNDGSTDFLIGTVTITSSAGSISTSGSVSLLASSVLLPWVASDGSIFVPAGWVLKAENLTQVTSAKTVSIVAIAGDY